ncbi:hypothetical protein NITMOv2_4430 [Nitrospira moscoviensis]|uniref:Uncharacterized protein n=1 Tax=Nitrospira moscoviensis TaxID=42253 RepID=A0A0K2GIN0_NITMO|nr:hypothetical protein NITMOv2_4430 [Nitrospira moscoviensis]
MIPSPLPPTVGRGEERGILDPPKKKLLPTHVGRSGSLNPSSYRFGKVGVISLRPSPRRFR